MGGVADIKILAEYTSEAATAQKNCARSICSPQTGFFSHVREGTADNSIPAGFTGARKSRQAVGTTVSWADAALLQGGDCVGNTVCQLPGVVQLEISSFKLIGRLGEFICIQFTSFTTKRYPNYSPFSARARPVEKIVEKKIA